ncbi:hypothetical protein GCM10010960_07040 [Arenimonas maotaiensis]|uniref:Uncharacterized protein n=1 Tax=Arenimonas maotaiensis TaxID=1446479 RepID=A0A917CFR1_9GAMM|nr:hypothetical protein [Arenimonas maotaiensis]GGF87695.1 hypothetical protein GCM10010960_07040 [Arenimonas maotaiensis]
MRLLALSLLLTSAFAAQASPEKPTDAELNDWMAFLRSISLPIITEVCTPLLADQGDYAGVAAKWLETHHAEIARGRDFTKAGSPKDRDFDQYHANMAADFKQKLLAKPEASQRAICTDSLNALQKSIPNSAG